MCGDGVAHACNGIIRRAVRCGRTDDDIAQHKLRGAGTTRCRGRTVAVFPIRRWIRGVITIHRAGLGAGLPTHQHPAGLRPAGKDQANGDGCQDD